MKTYITAVALAALLAVPAAAPASHDSSKPEVFKLKRKARSLSTKIAEQGIRARLENHDWNVRKYTGKCKRLSRTRRRCTYKFQDPLQQALGTGSYCSSKKGTTVRLVRGGKAISVGAAATKNC
jgi:hypothetical protein